MEYGAHTPYILAAYGFSIIAIGALIVLRVRRFKAALRAESESSKRES